MPLITIREDIFFSAWQFTFRRQLEGLYEGYCMVKDDNAEVVNITFLDFCLKVYAKRADVIDYSQN